jgi:tRNA (guanine37-N1)-methyltransferase
MMRVDILTIFPAMFQGPLSESIIGRAIERGIIDIRLHDIRMFTTDKHRTVDDYPFGGGAGMVMKPEPLSAAIEACVGDQEVLSGCNESGGDELLDDRTDTVYTTGSGRRFRCPVVLMTPQGMRLDQSLVRSLASRQRMAIVCGHYEGVDERVRYDLITHEISIGDYVLTGGELPAMVLIDAVSRMIPGVVKERESFENDSFYTGLLEHPHYTRPREFRGMVVPDVLLSGNHAMIEQWRRKESLRRTLKCRPDLLASADLSDLDRKWLREISDELGDSG